jgi:hypothetical protein
MGGPYHSLREILPVVRDYTVPLRVEPLDFCVGIVAI